MPSITLGDLKNLWQKVSDWVDGLYQPQVKIFGTDGSSSRQLKTNTNGELITSPSGSNILNHGLVGVPTAGTAVRISSDLSCREVTITAKKGNTGSIYVGGSTVSSTSYGVELAAGDSFTFTVNNANLIYIDSSVNGEGISYVAI